MFAFVVLEELGVSRGSKLLLKELELASVLMLLQIRLDCIMVSKRLGDFFCSLHICIGLLLNITFLKNHKICHKI